MKKDFVIVGSGIAGLSAAFFAGQKGKVTLITKGFDLRNSKSFANNDGILFSKNLDILHSDILKLHEFKDDYELKKVKSKIDFFIENVNGVYFFLKNILGVRFFDEGEKIFGFSEKNIFFSGERTGEEICKKFIEQIEKNPNIEIFLETEVTNLLFEEVEERDARAEFIGGKRVLGVIGKNLETGEEKHFFGKNTLLATGSGEGIYDFNYISDGIKLAKSVGAKIGKMHKIAWTPLCLDLKNVDKYFLPMNILNHGAFLVNGKGEKFLQHYIDPKKIDYNGNHVLNYDLSDDFEENHGNTFLMNELSSAVFAEVQKSGQVFLDMRYRTKNFWEKNFPELFYFLNFQKIDVLKDLIPIKNIQQFVIGGVEVSESAKTSVSRLYVSGELANFGVLGEHWLPGVIISKSIILSKSFVDNAVL
ncbi:FAD-binding protein [Candidatus Gracilibacteria bacterium]|nr:FAD-binding protein [Candidatus Gracilibacteria bacterium]